MISITNQSAYLWQGKRRQPNGPIHDELFGEDDFLISPVAVDFLPGDTEDTAGPALDLGHSWAESKASKTKLGRICSGSFGSFCTNPFNTLPLGKFRLICGALCGKAHCAFVRKLRRMTRSNAAFCCLIGKYLHGETPTLAI
nr:hypothetical protein [Mesorhizobium wenxiniae]